ncbi:MAG: TonB-dependent receptor family protein [Tannerellaceae bacterium]|nr:TonB-dependent receptor family protein [Tannerellaceae bacterium]
MRTTLLMTIFAAAAYVTAGAQISGKVTNRNGAPVEYATVVLQTVDSLYINAAYTDSAGRFAFGAEMPAYRLIAQHLTYDTYEGGYLNEYDITIELSEKENALGEVVVKGERTVVKLVDGRMTYDMPLLLSGATAGSAYEAMLRLPGVREQEGSLILAGAGGVTVIINGQATSMPHENLMAALRMYPAEMIQSAEIMYSAPPQYHMRGAAINLILKGEEAGRNGGLQGQANAAYKQKHFANYAGGFSLLIPASKLTADVNYAFSRGHERSGLDLYSNHLYDGTVNMIEQSNRGSRKSGVHNIRLGMNYRLTEGDRLNIAYTSQVTGGLDNRESSDGTFSLSDTHKENSSPTQMHNVLADYSSGFGLKTGIEYTSYNTHTIQRFSERMPGKENEFAADAKQEIDRYRLFADQQHTLPSELTLSYGAQYMYAADRSSQIYNSAAGDMSGMDISSRLTEHTANIYLGIGKSLGSKLSMNASVTGEYYRLAAFEEWTAFPALEITYFIAPSKILQLSFSSDKVYPAYWEMRGAVSYLNGYGEIRGNPLLRPYRDYSGQLNYILNGKYILTAFYNYMDGYSMQLPYQAHDRPALIYKTLNFDYKQTAGLNLIAPFSAGTVLNTRLTLSGFYDRVKSSHFHDISFAKDNFVFYARTDNTVSISSKPNVSLELNAAYISKNIQGPAELTSLWNLDAGLKWTFFNNMAELRLKGSDLFNSWTPDMIMKYDTQNLRMNLIPDARAITLSFTLKFGGYNKTYDEFDSSRFGTK